MQDYLTNYPGPGTGKKTKKTCRLRQAFLVNLIFNSGLLASPLGR
jgi:hypothetical protein